MRTTARAKINLYLHVAPPDARGYHPLRSMVAFADIGDELRTSFGGKGRLRIDGPYAGGLSVGEDNLVMKAVRLYEAETGKATSRDYYLTKNLPLASGIGGGSADAGAVLRLLRDPQMSDEALSAIAAKTGADGVMCLWSKACIAEGYGEKLSPIILPSLPCVLINPGVECSTPEVFRAFDAADMFLPLHSRWPGEGMLSPTHLGLQTSTSFEMNTEWQPKDVIDYLSGTRNDLETPATKLKPVIGELLQSLRSQPQTRLARMSGSGATCFALTNTDAEAQSLAAQMRYLWPTAWVRSCVLS